jgi:CNT family concentrative nucleoside transporter
VNDLGPRLVSCLGLLTMIALAWLASSDRRRFPWRSVAWGVAFQLLLGLLLLRTAPGRGFFVRMNDVVNGLLDYTQAGVRFVFGPLADTGFSFALHVLPVIVFMGSLFSVLYHLRLVQPLVTVTSIVLARAMRTSGAETLAAVANIFVGMIEAPLLVRPYVERMTRSELFCLMTCGMASIAGSVLLAYVQMLGGGEFAGHLVTASLLSAPAGLLISKVMLPETDVPQTGGGARALVERPSANVIDAAATGALDGLRLAAYVGAMLVAFVALVALVNDGLAAIGGVVGVENLTFQRLLGFALAPLAWLMGVAWHDAQQVGALLGVKTVLNEFIAYRELGELVKQGALAPRSCVIASYALCGFANFGSLAILIGGIGGMAPRRRSEVAALGLRSIASGSLSTFMTACVAGMLL